MSKLVEEIEGMLKVKKADLEYYWEPDTEGWVEALEYVLSLMKAQEKRVSDAEYWLSPIAFKKEREE